MNEQKAVSLTGLAKKLVQANLLDMSTASQALDAATKKKIPFVSYLVEKNIVDGHAIAITASVEFGDPLFDLEEMDLDVIPKEIVSEKLIRKHHALPLFRRGNRLYVAVSDPTNLEGLDEFKFHTGLTTEAILVEEKKLTEAIRSEEHTSELQSL
jgi:type IV pilus assembly protein PilB